MFSAAAREISLLGRVSVVGGINTLFGYAVIFAAMALGLSPYLSNALGYGLGVLCSFILHKKFVFAADGAVGRQLRRFLLTFVVAYGANLALLHALLQLRLDPLPAQLAASVAYLLCNYTISRAWVFRA